MPTNKERLAEMKSRFGNITESKANSSFKDIRLGSLMTDMERVFEIPAVAGKRQEAFERKNPEVMALYREVSQARSI